jgi:hypothetical protein
LSKAAAAEELRRPLDIEGWGSGGEPTVGWWQCGDGEVTLTQSHVAKGRRAGGSSSSEEGGVPELSHSQAEKGSRQRTGRGTQQATDGTRHRAAADRSHVRRIARPLRPVQRKKTRQGRAWAWMLSAQYTRKHVRRFGSGESVRLGATSAQSSEPSSRAKYTGQA